MTLIQPESFELLEVWLNWKKFGALPGAGDALDQPAHIFEAIGICEVAKADIEDRLRREHEQEIEKTKREAERRAAQGRKR